MFGTVIACMITFSFFFDNFNDNDIEKTLTESMEETEKEHQKIEKLLTKVSQELEKNGYGEFPLRYTSEKRLLTIQVKDEKIADSYGKEIKELIHDVAKEIKYEEVNVQFETLDINRQVNKEDKKLIELLHEVSKAQSIAQAGLTYSKDVYDLERFELIRNISVEIMSQHTGMEMTVIKDLFASETFCFFLSWIKAANLV